MVLKIPQMVKSSYQEQSSLISDTHNTARVPEIVQKEARIIVSKPLNTIDAA